jgi:hypothetical protein
MQIRNTMQDAQGLVGHPDKALLTKHYRQDEHARTHRSLIQSLASIETLSASHASVLGQKKYSVMGLFWSCSSCGYVHADGCSTMLLHSPQAPRAELRIPWPVDCAQPALPYIPTHPLEDLIDRQANALVQPKHVQSILRLNLCGLEFQPAGLQAHGLRHYPPAPARAAAVHDPPNGDLDRVMHATQCLEQVACS